LIRIDSDNHGPGQQIHIPDAFFVNEQRFWPGCPISSCRAEEGIMHQLILLNGILFPKKQNVNKSCWIALVVIICRHWATLDVMSNEASGGDYGYW
jgi:hypothetical protein